MEIINNSFIQCFAFLVVVVFLFFLSLYKNILESYTCVMHREERQQRMGENKRKIIIIPMHKMSKIYMANKN